MKEKSLKDITKEEFEQFIAEDLSLNDIAKKLNSSKSTVIYWIKKYGLKTKYESFQKNHSYFKKQNQNNQNFEKNFEKLQSKQCPKCNSNIEEKLSIYLNHVRWCGNPKKLKDKIEFRICACGSEYETQAKRPKKFCSKKCVYKYGFSEETKLKHRIKIQNWYENNPEKHPWKSSEKFCSHPCELLKSRMRESGIPFIEEFQPLENRRFSIDIALPGTNLAIEVNGNQHYDPDGKLKPYYQERHDILEANGWKVIEVHFSYCYSSDWVDSFLEAIVKDNDVSAFINLLPRAKQRREKKVSEARRTDPAIIERLRDMDKTHFGWVVQASKELGICTTHIRRLVLKHMPEQPRFERKSAAKV